jgi:hypothetical protein
MPTGKQFLASETSPTTSSHYIFYLSQQKKIPQRQ